MARDLDDLEAALATKARAGCSESFAALVERLTPSLMGYFAIRGFDPSAAEEGVQETFVRAYDSLASFDSAHAFRSWVYGIAHNVFLQASRQRRRHGHGELLESDAAKEASPDAALIEEERRAAIAAALAALPDRMQLVLQLRFFEKKSCEEIARLLGCTLEAVSPLIYRAKAALRARLDDRESSPLRGGERR